MVWEFSVFTVGRAQGEDFIPQLPYLSRHRGIRFGDGEASGCGFREGRIKGQGTYEGTSRALAEFPEIACRFGVQIRAVDDDGHGDAELRRDTGDAQEVLPAGEGRLGDSHGEGGAAE